MQPSKHTQSSPFSRYFKARLQPFTKPIFWGTSGVIVVLGVCLVQYSRNPEWLIPLIEGSNVAYPTNTEANLEESKATNKTKEELSRDDLAIGSEIDNLDVLFKEFKEQSAVGLTPEVTTDSKKKGKNKNQTPEVENWLDAYLKQQQENKANQSEKLTENSQNTTTSNAVSPEALLESLNKVDFRVNAPSTATNNSQQQPANGNNSQYQPNLPSNSPLSSPKTGNSALQDALNRLESKNNNPQPPVNDSVNPNSVLPQTTPNNLETKPSPTSNFSYSYSPYPSSINNATQTPANVSTPNYPVFQPKLGQNSANTNNINDRLFPQTNTQLGTTNNTSLYPNPLVTPQNQGLQPLQVPQNQLTPLPVPQQ